MKTPRQLTHDVAEHLDRPECATEWLEAIGREVTRIIDTCATSGHDPRPWYAVASVVGSARLDLRDAIVAARRTAVD